MLSKQFFFYSEGDGMGQKDVKQSTAQSVVSLRKIIVPICTGGWIGNEK